jgi:hypothetical protein
VAGGSSSSLGSCPEPGLADSGGTGGAAGNTTGNTTGGATGGATSWLSKLLNNGIFQKVGSTFAAAAAAYALWSQTEKETENPTAWGGIKTLGAAAMAFAAIYTWCVKMFMAKGTPVMAVHWVALATTVGIMAAIVAFAVWAGTKGDPSKSQDSSYTGLLPSWYETLPSSAVMAMTAGLTIGGIGYSLSPNQMYQVVSVPTVQLTAALPKVVPGITDGSQALGKILFNKGAGPNGSDAVLVTYPGRNGYTSMLQLNLDKNGYLIDKDYKTRGGPDKKYKPFYQPRLNNAGEVVDTTRNDGALNALLQIPACTAIANDARLDAQTREAALETCLRNNKDVTFVPFQSN